MKKVLPKAVVQQVKQLSHEVVREVARQPGELVNRAIEQFDLPPVEPVQKKEETDKVKLDETKRLQAMAELRQKFQTEMDRSRHLRERQIDDRRQEPAPPPQVQETKEAPLPEPSSKPKRGLFARQNAMRNKSQPEMVGRRVGG